MKRTLSLILAFCFIFTYTSCSKLKEKKMSVSLDEYLNDYPGLQAIAEEKAALDAQADRMQPQQGEDLVELAKILGKLYTVYVTEIPPLVQKEKEVNVEAINNWKERSIDKVDNAAEIAEAALNQLEVNALRDLLATKIKANEISKERFATLNLMANQLKAQAEDLIERSRTVNPSNQAQLLADQEAFNQFGTFIRDEQRWVMAHPPIEDREKIIQEWRMDHPHTEYLDQALKSYQKTYE